MKSTFITWAPHCSSSDALARQLGGKSHLIHYLGFKKPWQAAFKYPLQAIATLVHLRRDKPDVVLVASPPVIAVLPVYAYARLSRIPFVIDAHTGVFDDPRWTWLLPLSRALARAAAAIIVTNEHLALVVRSWGAQPVIVPSLPMTFRDSRRRIFTEFAKIVFINTFSRDEPLENVLKAAGKIPEIALYITGDLKRASREMIKAAPPNVHFTGWLPDSDYASLLGSATAVMALTTRNHTMQRGANEALELGKALITSDWPLLRQLFTKGAVFVDNSATGIAKGMKTAVQESVSLESAMTLLRQERTAAFHEALDELLTIIRRRSHGFRYSDKDEIIRPCHPE